MKLYILQRVGSAPKVFTDLDSAKLSAPKRVHWQHGGPPKAKFWWGEVRRGHIQINEVEIPTPNDPDLDRDRVLHVLTTIRNAAEAEIVKLHE